MTLPDRSDRSAVAEWRRTIDWPILVACGVLLAAGLLLSLAAGPTAAARLGLDSPYHYTVRHGAFVVFAGGLLLVLSGLDQHWVRRVAAFIFLIGFLAMAAIFLVGHEAKGAQRWLRIAGQTFQPSEVVKPALVVITAWLLAQRELFPKGPWAVVAFAFYATTLGFLLLQPDVGQAALLTAAFVITFFVSGLPWRWATAFTVGGAGLCAVLYTSLAHVRYRVNSFINPDAYDTYQVDKASDAIARGGLFGAGPGEGREKAALPDAHTDFIYAVASEEYGYVVALILLGLFAFITLRGLYLAGQLEMSYPKAAASGLFALFGLQAAINIAVNVKLLPPKGMTLPFISSGGSSMIGIAITLGLALALIRRHRTWVKVRRPVYA